MPTLKRPSFLALRYLVFGYLVFFYLALSYIALLIAPSVASAAEGVTPTNHFNTTTSHIRVIAASCAACHGTQGNSVGITPILAGMNADYFVSQMLAYKQGKGSPTVMHHHAKGLTVDEIHLLANYFAQQTPVSHTMPKTQTLQADPDE